MAMPVTYKPSPLGYGSPRSSPFRRPESPASPSSIHQSQTTPTTSPTKNNRTSAFELQGSATPSVETCPIKKNAVTEIQLPSSAKTASLVPLRPAGVNGNVLSQLQASQVRNLREGFQILDRDSDGVVNRDDVADMLDQLGLPSNQSDISRFFPPSAPQTMSLAVFMNSLANSLAALSPSSELLSAFSAFDDDDSGQIDLAELRDAILNTAPEPGERVITAAEVDKVLDGFTGRRAFSKSSAKAGGGGLGKRGKVFKYHDFVSSLLGNGKADQTSSDDLVEA